MQPASIRSHKFRHRPVGVDDGFLFQLAPSMRRNSGKEQREQSLESPTCLPPLLPPALHPPTPSGNQNREKFLQRGFFLSFLHVLDSPASGGSQPDVARNAKARPVFPFLIGAVSRRRCRRCWYNALECCFFPLLRSWKGQTLKCLHLFSMLSKWRGEALTSKICSSCCSRSNFLDVVVTRPVKRQKKSKSITPEQNCNTAFLPDQQQELNPMTFFKQRITEKRNGKFIEMWAYQ